MVLNCVSVKSDDSYYYYSSYGSYYKKAGRNKKRKESLNGKDKPQATGFRRAQAGFGERRILSVFFHEKITSHGYPRLLCPF